MSFFTSVLSGLTSGVSDTASALVAFFFTVTDGAMWRSLAWLLLGGILMGAGALLLVKSEITPSIKVGR